MLYLWVKFIHVLSSTILFGTGIGTACTLWLAHRSSKVTWIAAAARYVVLVDWFFTGISGILQPVTGFWLIAIAGYSFSAFWIWGAFIGYLIAGLCWAPVVWLQIKIRDLAVQAEETASPLPALYFRYVKY